MNPLSIHLDDTPALTLLTLKTECRRIQREQGLDIVFVDYIQLMDGAGDNMVAKITAISKGLKQLARELDVPVFVASQLSRALESRSDKRPVLSDLRESGGLEQDADVVIFIYRDDVHNEASERPNEADLIVSKHRNGETGTATLYFRKHLTQFTNLKRTSVNLEDF